MLLDRIERHLKRGRIPPTRFGRHAVNDPNFVYDLRDGRDPRDRTVRRVIAYLDQLEQAERERSAQSC